MRSWNWKNHKQLSNVVSINAAPFTVMQPNGKPVHGKLREILAICRQHGITEVTERSTGKTLNVNLETGRLTGA